MTEAEQIAQEIKEKYGWELYLWNNNRRGGYCYVFDKGPVQIRCDGVTYSTRLLAAKAALKFLEDLERENPLPKEAVEIIDALINAPRLAIFAETETETKQSALGYIEAREQADAFLARIKEQ